MQTDIREGLSRRIVEESPDAIIYADHDGLIQLWNAGAAAMFGYAAGEAIGQPLDLIIPDKLRARHWEGYHRVMATGVTRYGPGELLAVPGLHKDGSRMSLEFSIAILRDDSDQIMGIAAILRNVTARWEQDRALHQRIKELENLAQGAAS